MAERRALGSVQLGARANPLLLRRAVSAVQAPNVSAPRGPGVRTLKMDIAPAPQGFTDVIFIETGCGTDQHGQDLTKACVRACKDAISWNSIPSLERLIPGGAGGARVTRAGGDLLRTVLTKLHKNRLSSVPLTPFKESPLFLVRPGKSW